MARAEQELALNAASSSPPDPWKMKGDIPWAPSLHTHTLKEAGLNFYLFIYFFNLHRGNLSPTRHSLKLGFVSAMRVFTAKDLSAFSLRNVSFNIDLN